MDEVSKVVKRLVKGKLSWTGVQAEYPTVETANES
jgi:hypothetical protein